MLGSAATVTVVLGILLAVHPLETERLLASYVLLLAAIALLYLVRSFDTQPKGARRFEEALRRRGPAGSEPAELLRMQRELDLGAADAAHAHLRLLPLLRAAASGRLASRHGVDLGRRPEAARALLGDEVWELIRPDRPEPGDRHGPGVPRDRVAAVVDALESL